MRVVPASERPTPRRAAGPRNPPTRPPDAPIASQRAAQRAQRAAAIEKRKKDRALRVAAKAAPPPAKAAIRVVTGKGGKRSLQTPLTGAGLSVGEVDQVALVTIGVVLLVLYLRGVPQQVWDAAIHGAATPKKPPASASSAPPASASGSAPPSSGSSGTLPAGGVDLAEVANAQLGQLNKPNGVSWLNWCLQFVDDMAASAGINRKRDPTAIADAQDTAAFGPLNTGNPPRNALVYFSGGVGHVGIAEGDGTYVSAGLPGGVQRLPINWSSFIGWRNA